MHSSAVCNLFSKRWSGSICEHLGVKAGFRETLKYIVSSTSAKCSVTKSQRTVNEKDMMWLPPPHTHTTLYPAMMCATQEVNHCKSWVSNKDSWCMQSQVTESRPGKMNTTEGLCHHKVYAPNKATGKVHWFWCTLAMVPYHKRLIPFLILCLGIEASLRR